MRILYLTLFFIGIVYVGLSQSNPLQIFDPTPPSPDAAKLAQFDLAPVSLYTGTHSLSIPVYEIQVDGASIPIVLKYHSAGIRAAENASWVGLGWALSTGGSISRNVNGYNDLVSNNDYQGYVYEPQSVPTALIWAGNTLYKDQNGNDFVGIQDTEPDIFNYNFLNSSGKFILSKKSETGNVVQVIKLLENADAITFDEVNQNFTVITPNGFKGIFSVKEYVTSVSGTNGYGDWSACGGTFVDIASTMQRGGRTVTTWYLSEIISPNGKSIIYQYHVKPNGYSDHISISSKQWQEVGSVNSVFTGVSGQQDFAYQQTTQHCSRIITEHVFLSSIISTDLNLSISFNSTTREDLERLDPNHPQNSVFYSDWLNRIRVDRSISETIPTVFSPRRLTSIGVSNSSAHSNFHFIFKLNTSYFNADKSALPDAYDYLRLKLDEVAITDPTQTVIDQRYSFQYFDGVPHKSTLGFDYWGFYNGKDDNKTIAPVLTRMPPFFWDAGHDLINEVMKDQYYYQTENRKANFDFGKAGMLYHVTYPTGGTSTFEYEGHQYKLDNPEVIVPSGSTVFSTSGRDRDTKATFNYKGRFTGSCGLGNISIKLSTKCKDFFLGTPCTIAPTDVNKLAVELIDPEGKSVTKLHYDFQNALNLNHYEKEVNKNDHPFANELIPGIYTLQAYGIRENGDPKYYGDITVTVQNSCLNDIAAPAVYNQVAGGARVKSITNHDAEGKQLLRKSYDYSDPGQGGGFSSGKLMNPLMNLAVNTRVFNVGEPNENRDHYFSFTSGSAISRGNAAQGSHIGYTYVKESVKDLQDLQQGVSVYKFINEPNIIDNWSLTNFHAIANTTHEDINGSVMEQDSYYGSGSPTLSQTNITNNQQDIGEINAIKIEYYWNSTSPSHYGPSPTSSFYKIKRSKINVVQKISFEHFPGATEVKETKEEYSYNSRNQLTSKTIKDAQGNIIWSEHYKRPFDYANPSSVVQTMITKNMIDPIIESTIIKNGNVIDAKGIKYKVDGSRIVADKIYGFNRDKGSFTASTDGSTFAGAYDEEGQITQYDSKGNVLEIVSKSGTVTSFIWGYNQTYPVAKLSNVTRAQINAALGSNFHGGSGGVTQTQIKTAFPNALFTVYVVNPGIGIKEAIDQNDLKSTYDFDHLGRLLSIKDSSGHIQKTIDYHYSQR